MRYTCVPIKPALFPYFNAVIRARKNGILDEATYAAINCKQALGALNRNRKKHVSDR